jgi:hypothetical protein
MISRFKVHRHKTGRSHFDLRLIYNDLLRSWSLLKQPPLKAGERRLAIEREARAAADIDQSRFSEEAFGEGGVYTWDEGGVSVSEPAEDRIILDFQGGKLNGRYEIRRMRWYPGNRWIMLKL